MYNDGTLFIPAGASITLVNEVTPETVKLSKFVCPSTSKSLPTVKVVPSKVKLASSSNSPDAPTMTTLSFVKSLTCAESNVAPVFTTKPLEIFTGALISTNPFNVEIPVTNKFVLVLKPATTVEAVIIPEAFILPAELIPTPLCAASTFPPT